MAFECMEDCIHLKACRRVQSIGKKLRLRVPRYCDDDCTAYISGDSINLLTPTEAAQTAREQYDGKHDPYDVYAEWDFPNRSLGEIVESLYGG